MEKSKLYREFEQYYSDKYKVLPRLTTYAEIDGEPMQLTEQEVRYIQLLCRDTDNFDEFCNRYKIYSHSNREHAYLMKFRPDGIFSNTFEDGFFDVCDILALDL